MDEWNDVQVIRKISEDQAKCATPHEQLIGELLDSRIPKTEREHAAAREIEQLRYDAAKWQSLAKCYEQVCDILKERSGVVANAKRYAWLRDECIESKNPNHTWIVEAPPDMWDEAIDKAMKG